MENLLITESMKTKLLSTMKWLTFINIMNVVSLVFIIFVAIFYIGYGIILLVVPNVFTHNDGIVDANTMNIMVAMGSFIVIFGIFYLAMAGFYIIPLSQSFKFVSNLRSAFSDGSQMLLEVANDCYCKCIKYIGIGIIAYIIASIVFSIVALVPFLYVVLGAMH